jgi:hypothetical protein
MKPLLVTVNKQRMTQHGTKHRDAHMKDYRKKITTTNFILDLGLMFDACQELSGLSFDFQGCHMDLYSGNKKIGTVLQLFHERWMVPGPYYNHATNVPKIYSFRKLLFAGKVTEIILK